MLNLFPAFFYLYGNLFIFTAILKQIRWFYLLENRLIKKPSLEEFCLKDVNHRQLSALSTDAPELSFSSLWARTCIHAHTSVSARLQFHTNVTPT